MKILVIGGFGYIGSALVQHLNNQGLSSTAMGSRLDDYSLLEPVFLNSFDRIVLLAGHSSVPMCLGPIESPWKNNIINFKTLVQKVDGDIPIIYASSSSVYNNSGTHESIESDISLEYVNNYDLTKTVLDLYATQQIEQGRCLIGLRFGTVNGASSILRKELMINAMVYSALTDSKIVITNRHVNRPILGMNDLVHGIAAIVSETNNDLGAKSGQYNMSSFNTTVERISQQVADILNVPIIDNGMTDKVYNFSISNRKFETTFNLKLSDTVSDIVNTLLVAYQNPNTKLVARSEYYQYPAND